MKIVVMGAGALGSIVAALMHAAGHEVALVARGARAEHLKTHGVALEGLATVKAAVPVVTDASTLREADLLVLTVKTFDTAAALEQLKHIKVRAALSVQNGMMKEDQMAAAFGRDAVLLSTSNFSGGVRADGVTQFTVNLGYTIGELDGTVSPRVRDICTLFEQAGLKAIASAETLSAAWTKLTMWCGSAVACALTRATTPGVFQDPDGLRVGARVMREAGAVAVAEGATLGVVAPYDIAAMMAAPDETSALPYLRQAGAVFAQNMPQHKPSILQALEAGKRLEIEETLGDVIARAGRHGVPVPTIDAGYRLLAAIDRLARA
jgi:2-dehydropantoate 2-reductase